MTPAEIKNFCVKNAGQMASGLYTSTSDPSKTLNVSGRIIGFDDTRILLENASGKERVTKALPAIPTKTTDGWSRVVGPCKVGWPCKATSVQLMQGGAATTTEVAPTTEAKEVKAATKSSIWLSKKNKCNNHSECADGFCHREYTGVAY
jgi:hypothetical protein